MRYTILFFLLLTMLASCKKPETENNVSVDLSSGTWRISYFWDETDKTNSYTGYYFMFLNGGTLMAHGGSSTLTGIWSQADSRINISFSSPALSPLNGNWLATERSTGSIKLKNDNPSQDDQLHFIKN